MHIESVAYKTELEKHLNIYHRQGYNIEIVEYALETFLSNWRLHCVSSIMSVHTIMSGDKGIYFNGCLWIAKAVCC